jgi:putative endonuclease
MKPGGAHILTNKPDGVLYIGATDHLARRVEQHRAREVSGFTKGYNCDRLVWFERFDDLQDARLFEQRMKKRNRDWKVARIVERNPNWQDLVDTINR